MTWNGPINGDYSKCDPNKGPWAGGNMDLTHEEVMHVLDTCKEIADKAEQPLSDSEIYGAYNTSDWTYAVNWDTYNLLKGYDPEVNTLGINESGVIQPETEEQPIQDPAE